MQCAITLDSFQEAQELQLEPSNRTGWNRIWHGTGWNRTRWNRMEPDGTEPSGTANRPNRPQIGVLTEYQILCFPTHIRDLDAILPPNDSWDRCGSFLFSKNQGFSKNEPIRTSKNRCKLQKMFHWRAGLGAPNLEFRLDDENPTFRLVDENPTWFYKNSFDFMITRSIYIT